MADKWAVLIYMAATTTRLRTQMERDLREMHDRLKLLKDDDVHVYAQMDTPDARYVSREALKGPAPTEGVVRLPDCAVPQGAKYWYLQDFIAWRFNDVHLKDFDRTLLILWGHSQGIAAALSLPGSPAYALVGNGGFGINELSGDFLSVRQIRQAIAAGLEKTHDKIDILSFDSCFMGAAEVAAEFQPVAPECCSERGQLVARVDYVVASQSAVLTDGLDYGRVADSFVAKPNGQICPRELGLRLVEQANCGDKSPSTLSLLHTGVPSGKDTPNPYDKFQRALKDLVQELSGLLDVGKVVPKTTAGAERPRSDRPAGANRTEWLRIRDAFEGATWHRVRQFIDVADLCRRLANNTRDKGLHCKAIAVLDTLRPGPDGLVVDVRSTHPLVLSGVSLYCPWLFPTPDEVRNGAWNAVVDLFEYATRLWFNCGEGSWGAFVYNAKHILEESRQRAINTEMGDMRAAVAAAARGVVIPPPLSDGANYRMSKPPDDAFYVGEPFPAHFDGGGPPPPLRSESNPSPVVAPVQSLLRSWSAKASHAATLDPGDRVQIMFRRGRD